MSIAEKIIAYKFFYCVIIVILVVYSNIKTKYGKKFFYCSDRIDRYIVPEVASSVFKSMQ